MPTTLSPVDDFGEYPLNNMPVPGEYCTAELTQEHFQDVHNRIYHLKNALTTTQEDISNLEDSFTNLSSTVSGYAADLSLAEQNIQNIFTVLGVESFPVGWIGCSYIGTNDTFKSGVEKLDVQLKTVSDTLSEIGNDVTTLVPQVSSISGKISLTPWDGIPGLALSSSFYYAEDQTAEEALLKVGEVLEMFRHQTEVNKTFQAENWRDANADSSLIYDWLLTDTTINGTYSTTSCFSDILQRFGKTGGAWSFYSTVLTVPEGTNTIKIKWSENPGTVTASVILDGNYAGSFESIASQDTWVTVTAGTQLIIKFSGEDGSYLTGYQLLHKIVAP